jgi:2-phospho-L-lactate guanylyltransferase
VPRSIHVIVPFKLQGAKSRLASVLSPEERKSLALAMFYDVLKATSVAGNGTALTVLARPGSRECLPGHLSVRESERGLNDALNELIVYWADRGWPEDLLIVMADLALLTERDVSGMVHVAGDVVFSPGRGGGTNMILVRSPMFRTCYQGLSFPRHLDVAREFGLQAEIYESFRAGCDIDEPSDLPEILIHGRGESRAFLENLGFSLSEKGRSGLLREKSGD